MAAYQTILAAQKRQRAKKDSRLAKKSIVSLKTRFVAQTPSSLMQDEDPKATRLNATRSISMQHPASSTSGTKTAMARCLSKISGVT
jgi:hypothetical protein